MWMHSNIFLIVLGMGFVTYLPRVIPLTLLEKIELPPFLQECLKSVPYAILGALIFPGVLFIQENLWFGMIGAGIAFALAFAGAHVMVVVLGSILLLSFVALLF